jgi:hypothetical protein
MRLGGIGQGVRRRQGALDIPIIMLAGHPKMVWQHSCPPQPGLSAPERNCAVFD